MREGGTKPTDARDAKPNARVSQLVRQAANIMYECSNLSFSVFMVLFVISVVTKEGFGKIRFAANIYTLED